MSNITVQHLMPTPLDSLGAQNRANQTQVLSDSPDRETLASMDRTTLSYSFDQTKQSLSVVISDKTSGRVLRNIEFKFFHANLHRTDKLSGLLLDRQV